MEKSHTHDIMKNWADFLVKNDEAPIAVIATSTSNENGIAMLLVHPAVEDQFLEMVLHFIATRKATSQMKIDTNTLNPIEDGKDKSKNNNGTMG